jgi:hypothetical protein
LTFLWTVDPIEVNAYGVVIVQNLDGVAVEDPADLSGDVGSERGACSKQAAKDYDKVCLQETALSS